MVPPATSATASPTASAGESLSQDERADRARQLFENHSGQVLRFLRRRDPDLAEDALSETFAVAVRRAADIPSGHELPWLYVVAEHVLRNLQRSRRRAARIPEALQPFTRHTSEAPGVPYVGQALGELPDRERILLTMTAFEGLSANEAADLMGIPYGSARNALSSGRKRLAVVLASAAAVVLIVGVVVAVAGMIRSHQRQPLQTLASSLSQARVVHDVAVVRRGSAAQPAGAEEPARYERWSDRAGERTRVRLPGGTEVLAADGQTLRSAAGPATASTSPARRAAIRDDLGVLDAASPTAIAALLADPAAQRTATEGPPIGGRDTTTLRGRIVDASGAERAVRVYVADDEPTVLRVRVRPTGQDAGPVATVDFLAWSAIPRGGSAAAPSTPQDPPPRTPAPASAAGGRTAAPDATSRPASGLAAVQRRTSVSPASETRQVPAREPRPASDQRAAPIVHVRSTVQRCWSGGGNDGCLNLGDREVWVELGGLQRSRTQTRRPIGGPVRIESWSTPQERRSYSVSKDGARTYGTIERFATRQTQAPLPEEWFGSWQATLAPAVAELQGRPEALSPLPLGPDVEGRSTRVRRIAMPSRQSAALTAEIIVDGSTGDPLTVTVSSEQTGAAGPLRQSTTLTVASWEQLSPGAHAALLTAQIPKGARLSIE